MTLHYVCHICAVPYWIVSVGPVVEGSYDYVVATDDKSQMLFILARDMTAFAKYEKDVKIWVENQGFMGPRFGPQKSVHTAKCAYGPAPPGSKPVNAKLRAAEPALPAKNAPAAPAKKAPAKKGGK